MDRDPGPVPITEESPDQDMLVSYNTVPVPGVVCLVQHVLEQPGAGLDQVECGKVPGVVCLVQHVLEQPGAGLDLVECRKVPGVVRLVQHVLEQPVAGLPAAGG
jgi:hypothetical protein